MSKIINSSITCTSLEPLYNIAVPIKNLNLYNFFNNKDADNINAINNYLSRCNIDLYAVNKTANNILLGNKKHSTIDLVIMDYYIKLKGILYGSGFIKDYKGPSFSYIRKTKMNEYVVFFNIENKFKSEDVMANLSIKAESPIWMKNSSIIELKFINSTFLDRMKESDDEQDDEDYQDDWWKK